MNIEQAAPRLAAILNARRELAATLGLPPPEGDGFCARALTGTLECANAAIHLTPGPRPTHPDPGRCHTYLVADARVKPTAEAVLRLCPAQTQVLNLNPTRATLQPPSGHTIAMLEATELHRAVLAERYLHRWSDAELTELRHIAESVNHTGRTR